MRELGWDPTDIPAPFLSLATAGERIVDLLGADDFGDQEVVALLEVVVRVAVAVHALESTPVPSFPDAAGAAEFWSTIARELLDSLLIAHLVARRTALSGALKLLGLVRETPLEATPTRMARVKREVRWEPARPAADRSEEGLSRGVRLDRGAAAARRHRRPVRPARGARRRAAGACARQPHARLSVGRRARSGRRRRFRRRPAMGADLRGRSPTSA